MGDEKSSDTLRVIGIPGSLRDGFTRKALKIALEGARELGAETELLDLNSYDLVFCDGRDRNDYPEGVHRLRQVVKFAHGIILGTPEYHSGVSGVLKNALDLMGFDEFEGKMIGLVGVAGGSLGAVNSLNSLRTVGRSLHAWVLPDQVSIPQSRYAFDDHGKTLDPKLEERLLELGRQVTRFAFLHSSQQMKDFLEVWEEAPENPGG